MADFYVRWPTPGSGGGSGGVTSLNGLTGAITLAAGSGISLTPAGNTITIAATGSGTGTVTSVAMTVPSFLNVVGSPITTSGTFAVTLNDEVANTVFAGPASGADAAPTFRALVPADIPGGTGTPDVLAYYDASGNLNPLGQWTVDPDDFNLTSIVSISDTRAVYDQIRLQTNLGGTITGTASSLDLSLSSAGSTASITGINLGIDGTVVGNTTLISAGSSANTSADSNGIVVGLSGAVFGNQIAFRADVGGSVVGDSTGLFLNMGAPVSGNSTVLNEFVNSSVAGDLNFVGLFGNSSAAVGGDYRGIQIDLDAAVSGFAAGTLVTQNGTVTKGWTGFGSYVNADIGDGSGINAIGFDASFQNHTVDGTISGFNFNNSSTISGTNSIYVLNANNTGAGYRFVGTAISNNANQTEEFRGLAINNNANSRTSTGVDVVLQGTVTDDVTGFRINLNNTISTSQTPVGLSISMGNATGANPQGVVGISSDGRVQVNATTQLVSGQGFQVGNRVEAAYTVPPGSPVTGTDSLGNNFAGDMLAQDDIALGPAGIGWNSVGFIASVGVAVGKTIDSATVFLPAASTPDPGYTTGGSITDFHVIRSFIPLSQGGSFTSTNYYSIKLDPLFGNATSFATNAWGIWSGDTTADNWFAKNVVIGGSTGKPTGAFVLDATGNSILHGTLGLEGSTSGIFIQAAADTTTDYSVKWPATQGAASTVITNDGSGNLSWSPASGSSTIEVAVFNETQASGTPGGTFTSGSWVTRTINNTQTSQTWASLLLNQITLDAGTYLIEASAPFFSVDGTQAKLYNITDAADELIGQSSFGSSGNGVSGTASVIGVITIASPKAFEVQHQGVTTHAVNGLGVACGFSLTNEVYTQITITKLA